MAKDFTQVMSERTDKQLIEIISIKRDEYQPEALVAAEKEIAKRNLDPEKFNDDERTSVVKETEHISKREMQFKWYHKIITFLLAPIIVTASTPIFSLFKNDLIRALGFPLIVIVHMGIYRFWKDKGYVKMAADFYKWVIYTIYIYIGIGLITGLLFFLYVYLAEKN